MYELISKIDGPSGLPFFGNALEFIGDPHSKFILKYKIFPFKYPPVTKGGGTTRGSAETLILEKIRL